MRGLRRLVNQAEDFIASLAMMADGGRNPGAMSGKRVAMAGQNEIHIQAEHVFERFQELRKHVAAGGPGNVGRDVLQNLIARKQKFPFTRAEADATGRMARCPHNFKWAVGWFAISA